MRRAFTLVELLVVIAIIAILLSILAPAMRTALGRTDTVKCANNMRQFALAFSQYAAQNRGNLPAPNWRKAGAVGWLYRDLKMDQPGDLQGGQLWEFIKAPEVYRCPADMTVLDQIPNRPNNSRAITSYCMNGSVCGYGARAFDGTYWNTYKQTDFEPTDIIMWEADESKAGGWWWDGANYPWEGITGRHVDRGMVVTATGSAEWLLLEDYYRMGASNAPRPNRLWNVPGM